jgi:hypothetical protein
MMKQEAAAYSIRPSHMMNVGMKWCAKKDRYDSCQMSESDERRLQRRSAADRLIPRAENSVRSRVASELGCFGAIKPP